ncbi:flavodoxin domain-containing protein [Burkholderia cenocepacia]|uniref:flavodoxin family protein n=2 Tax=Burkholderia cenocepacia TaxID=95486 RepID=UPI00054CDF26|nr:flavodoxin [Burkholderia cenocepacia]MCW3525988.1 flavodoxin domain-containing protein [Burkholderia cenocepacia]MCW3616074.1 flavodoxin domain-containing protein [Burkholderia cenocepacia]MCW3653932.1 flavodoxin domain-containing protein [Burkholderia cenocepacia]MCW3670022.1 flavodoxin domain-containing protein [Burkholderia cenocepacia]MCW3684773.1 flavodoxin domain-containing protein [Burkholderia cenocepacia]
MDRSRRMLVVFYSRSETTTAVARRLADTLGADCERLREVDDLRRKGAVGFLRSLADVIRDGAADLRPTACLPSGYDAVVIGTPIWAGRASTPVSTWLARHGSELRATAFFCTMGLRGDLTAFGQMQALARQRPIATCAISGRDIGRGLATRKLARFARSVVRRLAARERYMGGERAT